MAPETSQGPVHEESPQGDVQADFFISRAGADAPIAEAVGRILEGVGYRVLLQQWDFGNQSFIAAVHAALNSDARVIALLSEEYLASQHCAAEWGSTLTHDPNNEKGRLIIFRIGECVPTGLLAPLVYVDLVSIRDDPDSLRGAVLEAVQEGRRKAPRLDEGDPRSRESAHGPISIFKTRLATLPGRRLAASLAVAVVGLALVWIFPAENLRALFVSKDRFMTYAGVGIHDPGGNLTSGNTFEDCAAKCLAEQNCNAFSFLAANQACFLKPTYQEVVKDERVMTGVRATLPSLRLPAK